jgi:hypothetical protein
MAAGRGQVAEVEKATSREQPDSVPGFIAGSFYFCHLTSFF